MIKISCKTCNKSFSTFPCRLKIKKGIFCSKKCSYQFREGKPAWNKGLTKFNDKRMKKLSLDRIGSGNPMYGKQGWMKGKKFPEFSGKNHPLWKGEKVSYNGLHKWVSRYLGKANKCEFCGKEKTTPKSIQWANKSGKYKRKLNDWIQLCVSCHCYYDSGKISIYSPNQEMARRV